MSEELDFQKVMRHLKLDLPVDKHGDYIDDVQYYYSAARSIRDLRDLWWRTYGYYDDPPISLKDFIKFDKGHLALFKEYFRFKVKYITIYDDPFFDLKCELLNNSMTKIYKEILGWDREDRILALETVSSGISFERIYEQVRVDIQDMSHKIFFVPESLSTEDVCNDMSYNPFLRWRISEHVHDMCADYSRKVVI